MFLAKKKFIAIINSAQDQKSGYERLLLIAQIAMKQSTDVFHDSPHPQRMLDIFNSLTLPRLTAEERQIAVLVIWWHDISRALLKKPHYFFMIFLDDIFSAYCLRWCAKKIAPDNQVIKTAVKLLLLKSLVLGPGLKKLVLSKRLQWLTDLLFEIDFMDNASPERIARFLPVAAGKKFHLWEYKYAITLSFRLYRYRGIKVPELVPVARNYFQQVIAWAQTESIKAWHLEHLGEKWFSKNLQLAKNVISNLTS